MPQRRSGQYQFLVSNRPSELAKVTRLLIQEGIQFDRLSIATIDDKALIRFSA